MSLFKELQKPNLPGFQAFNSNFRRRLSHPNLETRSDIKRHSSFEVERRPVLNRIIACRRCRNKKRVTFQLSREYMVKHIIVIELVGFLNDQPTPDLRTQASVLEYLWAQWAILDLQFLCLSTASRHATQRGRRWVELSTSLQPPRVSTIFAQNRIYNRRSRRVKPPRRPDQRLSSRNSFPSADSKCVDQSSNLRPL